jgi:type II secretory pathway pseudopilin PulG
MKKRKNTSGFTLVEVLVATLLGMTVLGMVVSVFTSASDAGRRSSSRADIQQSARGSLAIINRDMTQASIGVPQAGIALPSGAGSTLALFACSPVQCYLPAGNNTYPNNTLSPVTPGENKGPNGTDVVTIAYLDATWPVSNQQLVTMAPNGSSITVNTGTFDTTGNPAPPPTGLAYNDPVFGTKVGDVLMISNLNGAAVATVTKVDPNGLIELKAGDPLNLNQPNAAAGNVAGLYNPLIATSAARLNVVTYFIQILPGPDGILGTADDIPTLYRQLNAQVAIPVAEYVTNMQFTYDIYNAATATYSAGLLGSAVANASEIRKVTVLLTLRSEYREPQGNFHTLTVSSAVSPRDLSFTNRYQ